MRLLLDTHAFIWWAGNDPSLTMPARTSIADTTNEIFLSAVSTWEMAIKIAIGKLVLAGPLDTFVSSQLSQYQFKPLPVTYDHTYRVGMLPQHHRDPFDRLLIAQAMVENLILLTCDPQFGSYGVQTLW
ncbi:MAG: type II toxin-antitoxin system VapC family toxin [Terriglobia bacterium]